MSSLLEQDVVAISGITVPGTGSDFTSFSFDLWDVPGNIPSRIESVTFQVTYPSPSATITDVFEIVLQSQSGMVLDRQTSPVITPGVDQTFAFLTWVRRGNDTAQTGLFQFETQPSSGSVWWRGTLPEFVLESQGSVVLNLYRGSDGNFDSAAISDIVLSYTPAEGGNGTITQAYPQPYLVPATG